MIYIGIDPDVDKNGFAYYHTLTKSLELKSYSFWDLIEEIERVLYILDFDDSFHVVIEGGWLNKKSNWHGGNKLASSRIAKNVGSNHQVGKLIVEYCEQNGIPHEVVKPTKSKLNAETFKKVTGYEGRTNQETRDAAMLVFGRK